MKKAKEEGRKGREVRMDNKRLWIEEVKWRRREGKIRDRDLKLGGGRGEGEER